VVWVEPRGDGRRTSLHDGLLAVERQGSPSAELVAIAGATRTAMGAVRQHRAGADPRRKHLCVDQHQPADPWCDAASEATAEHGVVAVDRRDQAASGVLDHRNGRREPAVIRREREDGAEDLEPGGTARLEFEELRLEERTSIVGDAEKGPAVRIAREAAGSRRELRDTGTHPLAM